MRSSSGRTERVFTVALLKDVLVINGHGSGSHETEAGIFDDGGVELRLAVVVAFFEVTQDNNA